MIAASALRSPHEAAERGQSTWVVSESDAAPAARPYLSTQVDAGKAGRRFVRRSASAFNMRIGCRYEPYVPNPPELPLPLPLGMVYPVNEIVRVDYFLPGWPRRRATQFGSSSPTSSSGACRVWTTVS